MEHGESIHPVIGHTDVCLGPQIRGRHQKQYVQEIQRSKCGLVGPGLCGLSQWNSRRWLGQTQRVSIAVRIQQNSG